MKSLSFTILIGLLLASCAAPVPEVIVKTIEVEKVVTQIVEKEVIKTIEVEVVTQVVEKEVEVEKVVTVESPTTVVIGVAGMGQKALVILNEQIERFNSQDPLIQARLEDRGGLEALLLSLLIGEVDVAELRYNQVAMLQLEQVVMPLDDWFDGEDFLQGALDSTVFDGQLYSLPWRRSACLPHYYYLAMGTESRDPDAAFALMDFLTQEDQQVQNFGFLDWYPTRQSLYDPLGLGECLQSPIQAIRLEPQRIAEAISTVKESWHGLEHVLEGQTINVDGATAVIENEEVQGTGASVMDPLSAEEFEAKIDYGVIVGVLNVDKAPEYDPGDYVVKWRRVNGEIRPYLVKPGGQEIEVQFERLDATQVPVGQPFCEIETGSFRKCWCLDSLCGCIRVG